MTRREWLRRSAGAALGARLGRAQTEEKYTNYFGDLHNHNVVGYAQGSLERTYEIARNHLDFFAFTPHASWHDIGRYENSIEDKWINGFAVTRARWPEVLAMARRYDAPGKFVVLAGYECHSTSVGDYHVIFPDLDAELALFPTLKELQAFARRRGCLLIPHHPANRLGRRGADFSLRDPAVSPVLEMYSEWGNAEHDRAPMGYIRHTETGRWTKNTVQYLLAAGHRFGFIASSDDHLGYPGGYREGLAAVKCKELSRAGIIDALRNRRCYAVTGDRIALDSYVNGRIMGQAMPYARQREIRVAVSGWDQVDRVEVLKNNRVIHRDFPMDRAITRKSWDRPVLVRYQYGWGPWPALGMARTADWDIRFQLEGGVLEDLHPCFLPGPLEEGRRDVILERSERGARVKSFTALRQQVDDYSQKAVVLKVRGGPETKLTVALDAPAKVSLTQTLAQLVESNEALYTGEFPKESSMLERVVFAEHYQTEFTVRDEDGGEQVNWYYVRVVQANGQHAWSSPIWVEKAA